MPSELASGPGKPSEGADNGYKRHDGAVRVAAATGEAESRPSAPEPEREAERPSEPSEPSPALSSESAEHYLTPSLTSDGRVPFPRPSPLLLSVALFQEDMAARRANWSCPDATPDPIGVSPGRSPIYSGSCSLGPYETSYQTREAERQSRSGELLATCWCLWLSRREGTSARAPRSGSAVHLLAARTRDGHADWAFMRARALCLACEVVDDPAARYAPDWEGGMPVYPRYRLALLLGGHGQRLQLERATLDEAEERGWLPNIAGRDPRHSYYVYGFGRVYERRQGTWMPSETFPTPLLRQQMSAPSLLGRRPRPSPGPQQHRIPEPCVFWPPRPQLQRLSSSSSEGSRSRSRSRSRSPLGATAAPSPRLSSPPRPATRTPSRPSPESPSRLPPTATSTSPPRSPTASSPPTSTSVLSFGTAPNDYRDSSPTPSRETTENHVTPDTVPRPAPICRRRLGTDVQIVEMRREGNSSDGCSLEGDQDLLVDLEIDAEEESEDEPTPQPAPKPTPQTTNHSRSRRRTRRGHRGGRPRPALRR
ncbi:protein RL1 [Aotine betaherpesvirus 1]|uniref:Protein RL1 n=1 Tax=Aotine betaherpesvirus 1 TaxID=50290 RepID=G8XU74_9BETA|nr:protein RL1 [Aotine betaherpesvirus 1]AEV80716.1 protein RL1 [Aotine betaherpesvirus 1]